MPARGGVASPAIRAWLSYLADLSLAEDDHEWQALLLWKTPGGGTARRIALPAVECSAHPPEPIPAQLQELIV